MSGNTRLKRKLGKDPHDGDGKRVPSKRSKGEFNAFEFKSKLKEHTKALPALTNFIQLVKEDDSSNDVVDSYLKISGECNEIFNLMEGERRPGTEMQIIFEALECILVRITDRLKHHKATALQIVQRMLQNHMKPIYNALSVGSTSRYLKLCLRLLTAMVMQDTLTAREVQTHFNFQLPSLVSIMNRRDSKGATEDVRICFARFATSFLISSDDQVIQKLIEVRGFFNGILRGIKTDRASTVHLLLTTLKEKVINNSAISKTSKMRLFSENTLQNLVSLYKWEGQYDFELDQNKTDDDDDNEDIQGVEGLSIIRNLVQDFLITLTCSYKFGINFYDRSIGTSGRNQNTILLKFLLSLKSITSDPLVVDLIIKILTACPDLLSKYLTQSDQSFSPRLSERWLTNMDLLMKVYQNQPEVPPSFQVTDKVPVSKLVTMTMVTTVPVVATRAMLSQGIKSVSRRVQFITLKLMSMILKRVKSALEHCQHPDSSKICTVYNGEERQKFIELYQESLCKILPEIHIISSCWQKVTKKNQRGVKDKKENSMETGVHEDVAMETKAGIKPEGAETDEKAPPVTVLKAQILQVLCSYQHTFPESFVQCDYDFSRLLYGVISTDTHTDMTDDTSHLTVQYFAFQLLLHSAPGKFRWFKNVKGQGTGISILLELLVTTQHPQLKSITRQLIDKVLQETGIFELTQDEISIWLSELERQDKSDTSVLIDYMERLLIKVVFNPYPLTDRIIDIVSEANTMNSDSGDDTHSVGESGIDAILSMGDISMEAGPSGVMSSPELSNKSSAWCSESFPFSPLVVGVLQDWVGGSDNIKSGCVDKFLFEIIKDILHGQLNPAPLCLLVQQIFTHDNPDQEAPPPTLSNHQKELLTYTAMFLPSNKKVEKTPKKKKSEKHQTNFDQEMKFSDIIYDGFQTRQGDGILCNTEEVKNCIDKIISIDDIILAVKQVLLYANSVITCPTIHKIAKKKTLLKTYFLLVEKLHQRSLKVVENLQMNETHETDHDDDVLIEKSKNDDFIGELNLNELTQTKKKHEAPQVLEVVLSHPLCLEWFLPSVDSVPNSTVMMSSEERSELSALITEFVFDFLKYILDKSTQSEITRIMSPYITTTVAFVSNTIQNLGKKDKKGQNIDGLELEQGLKVLLTLQQFWSASDVQGLVDKCLQMSHDRLVSVTDDGSKVTVLGETLLTFLESCHISSESFRKLITLMHGSKCVEVDRAVFNMINNNPQLVFNTTMTTMKYCLQSPSQVRIQLAVLLLTHSLAHHIKFQEWCSLQDSEDDHMTNHKDVYLPLVCVFMRRATTSTPLGNHIKSDVIEKLNRIYQTWLSTWLVDGSHGNSSENDIKFTVWCQLLKCTDSDTQIEILRKLQHKVTVKQVWSRYQVEASLKILQSLESSSSSSSTKGKLPTMSLSFITGCLQCLNVQHKAERQDDQLESILYQSVSTVAMELDAISSSKEFAPVWNRFVKTGLKCRYRNERLLQTLMLMVPKVYHSNHNNKTGGMVYLPTIYQMVLSHSQFLSTMLATEEHQQQSVRVKETLVKFLVLMADLNPVCCETAHFGVLLSAYGATLSKTDQLLLYLMNIYENNDAIMWEFRPYIWGPSALDHHSNRKKFGRSLWNEPNMRDILNLLDKDKMYETVMKFPWRRTLKASHHDNRVVDSSVYDPSFLLPLFSHLLTPESVVDCKRFIEWHGLGLAVATLSSIDSAMRAAAYHVIMSYFHHLEGARFHEQRQILYLLNCLKNSITEPNTRISSVMTIFITKVIQLFLTPQSAMYSMVQKFLLIKPEFNLHTIPQLQRLLFSSDMEYKQQHTWILQLCEAGLKDHTDFYIYNKKCHLFKLIMAFYNSPTCNKATKQQILKILECAIVIRSGAMELGRYQGLLPWLHSNIIRGDGSLLEDTLTIVSKFWLTMSSSPGKQTNTDTGREGKQESTVSLRTIVGVLQICAAVIQQLQERVTPQFLHSLMDLIHSVMSYQHKIYGDTVTWHVIKPDHFVVCLYKYGGIFQDQEILENLKGESSGLIGKSQGKNVGKERKKQSGDKDEKRADEEEICSDLQNECLQNLLQTLYCLGSQSFTKSQLPSLSVIFLLRWSLQRTYEMSNIKIQTQCMLQQLIWMCDIIRNSEDVKDLLLKEVEPDLVSLLLKVYSFTLGRMFNVPSHVTGSDVTIEEEVEKSFQSDSLTQEQSIVCNDILNTLNAVFWHLTQHCMLPTNEDKYGEFGSLIRNDVYTINLKVFSHNAAESAEVHKSTELEAMLMQELWTKCDEPSHFMMAQQTQQTVLPVSQKKSKKTEGKKPKVKTPRKSSKKKLSIS
ncbi:nucleolar pre-ribosomal-associated protein 1-like [Glandiceps talaboti]